jgi:phage terminase large subunit
MLVSRDNILTNSLTNFGPKRFIKLDVYQYLEMLGKQPNPPQIALINAINNPDYRFVTAAISRRVGKTFIANVIGQLVLLVPGSQVLIMAPNYRLAQISFELQRELIAFFGIEVKRDNAKDNLIELVNGSTIRIGAVTQVDSVVGRSYDLIIFDEAALTREGETAFNVRLRPTLDKPNSKAIFISTPRGRNNWFHNFYQRGFSPDFPQWASIHATYADNPRADLNDVDQARREMSAAEFKQEYEADFAVFEGRIWEFDFKTCVRDLSEMDRSGMDMIGGLDAGYKDPCALIILGYHVNSDTYYAFAERLAAKADTRAHAQGMEPIIEKYEVDMIYADPAAAQFRADLAAIYGISTINAKKSVLDGINHVGSILESNRLIVDPSCVELLKTLEQYSWAETTAVEKPKHDEFSHMADALRYALYTHTTAFSGF